MEVSIDGKKAVITAGASGICRKVAEVFIPTKVKKNELGAKSGKGFYEWTPAYTQKWRLDMYRNLVGHRRRDLAEKSREKLP